MAVSNICVDAKTLALQNTGDSYAKKIIATLIATLLAPSAQAGEVTGYLYTTLNGETTNKVVSFERNDDGTLGKQVAYSTKSLGGANRSAGGDAAGDFDSQGAVQPNSTAFQFTLDAAENYLYVVNQRIDQTSANKSDDGNVLHTFEIVNGDELKHIGSRHLARDGVQPRSRPQGLVAVDIE